MTRTSSAISILCRCSRASAATASGPLESAHPCKRLIVTDVRAPDAQHHPPGQRLSKSRAVEHASRKRVLPHRHTTRGSEPMTRTYPLSTSTSVQGRNPRRQVRPELDEPGLVVLSIGQRDDQGGDKQRSRAPLTDR